ncbi:MAG: site-specific integrase [Bryobacterales bacterium]|nr:site-specific integrase [Bryobacterales bacterium]
MHDEGTLHALTGGLKAKVRVQHPKILEAKFREGWKWFFRYYADEVQADGSVKTVRKKQAVGFSRGDEKITKKEAEVERDKFLRKLNAPTIEDAVEKIAETGVALIRDVARMFEEGYLSREKQLAKATRDKYRHLLNSCIVPKWGTLRLNQLRPQAVEDWLHSTFDSWWTMYSVRATLSQLYYYAEGHGLWEEGRRSPASKAKLGRKRYSNERRILSFEETARVLARMNPEERLVIELCIATGVRISEALGLQWKHVNLGAATIRIEQRVWHQEVGPPKTEASRRILGLGDLAVRLREEATRRAATPDDWVFPQKHAPGRPMWDSTVREALHEAARAEGCDFRGLGAHTFRRANITWRQEVGGSAIEASKIAGHCSLEMTSHYTFVAPERQNELTRRIQQKLAAAAKPEEKPAEPQLPPSNTPPAAPPAPETPPNGGIAISVTTMIQ